MSSPKAPIFAALTLLATSLAVGCTLSDIYDEVRILSTIPAPQSTDTPYRLSKRIKLSEDADRVEEAHLEMIRITVISPDTADLSVFLGIKLFLNDGSQRPLLAETSDLQPGTRSVELEIAYTGDLKRFLDTTGLLVEWEVYYRSTAAYPAEGIQIETVLGFNADVELI
ncbi:MAG: hypothetical protein JW797_13280 [Bradymonadales bacterium]|nr:hypothetical protein [Bradymonadales bacterium]